MDVQKEISQARKKRNLGVLIVFVSLIFLFASLVLSLLDYSQYHGLAPLERLTTYIIESTQFPILSSVWEIAARPDSVNILQPRNLWFVGEILVFVVGVSLAGTASATLKDIADAKHKAKQQIRQDQFQQKQ